MAATTTTSGKPSGGVRRVLSRTLGFTQGYNTALFIVLGGITALFSIARLPAISLNIFCKPGNSIPGECFHYEVPGRHQTGLWLHLSSILPGSLLALVQFVPAVRRRALNVHRYAGYAVWVLSVSGTVGMFMLLDKAAGGFFDTWAVAVVLSTMFLGATFRAYQTIRELRIDQHRAWMLRAWVYAWCIVTMRPVLITCAIVVSKLGPFYSAQPCGKIDYALAHAKWPNPNITLSNDFPSCTGYAAGVDPTGMSIVKANVFGNVVERASAINIVFGSATWICMVLHAVLVELYVSFCAPSPSKVS